MLLIRRSGLAVEVRFVFKGIENLDFVDSRQVDAAVTAPVPLPLELQRLGPLNMQLTTSERAFRGDSSLAADRYRFVANSSAFAAGELFRMTFAVE